MSLPFRGGTFRASFSLGVLEHYSAAAQIRMISEMARVTCGVVIVMVPNTGSPVFRAMEEGEFASVDAELVYPDEGEQHKVDFDELSAATGLPLVKRGGLHIVPPSRIGSKHLTPSEREFYVRLCDKALRTPRVDALTTWMEIEEHCTSEELSRYGWFAFAVLDTSR
jgi:hypothetical protein